MVEFSRKEGIKMIKIGLISHLIRDYNLGCSALAISNIALMDEVFKANNIEVEYVVLVSKPKDPHFDLVEYTRLDGITKNKFSYRTFPRLKESLKKPWTILTNKDFLGCDFIIDLCGGDGYTDNYGKIRILAESLPVYIAKFKKIPFVFAPQTIGPFNTKYGAFIAKHTLSNVKQIFVRDISSMQCCADLHVSDHTRQVIDVAFALPYVQANTINCKKKIGINVSGLLYNGGYNRDNYFNLSFSYKDFVETLIEHIQKKNEYEIHLLPHVNTDDVQIDDDYRACELLKRKYPAVILAPRFDSPIDAKSYIAGMDLFTGARMHSTIGAISSGVPVIPVAYSRKFNGLYKTLNYPYIIDAKANLSVDAALDLFDRYVESYEEMKAAVNSAKLIYTASLDAYKKQLEQLFLK